MKSTPGGCDSFLKDVWFPDLNWYWGNPDKTHKNSRFQDRGSYTMYETKIAMRSGMHRTRSAMDFQERFDCQYDIWSTLIKPGLEASILPVRKDDQRWLAVKRRMRSRTARNATWIQVSVVVVHRLPIASESSPTPSSSGSSTHLPRDPILNRPILSHNWCFRSHMCQSISSWPSPRPDYFPFAPSSNHSSGQQTRASPWQFGLGIID